MLNIKTMLNNNNFKFRIYKKKLYLLSSSIYKVIIQIKSWGATGVLFEWEDTFPYTGDLQIVGSIANAGGDGLYSIEETRHLLDFANQNGLVPVSMSNMSIFFLHSVTITKWFNYCLAVTRVYRQDENVVVNFEI